MVAGEASGDLLASLLIGGLQARWPDVALAGIGGPKMAALGFDALWPSDRLAVRGYVEVLRHYRAIKRVRDELGDRLLACARRDVVQRCAEHCPERGQVARDERRAGLRPDDDRSPRLALSASIRSMI